MNRVAIVWLLLIAISGPVAPAPGPPAPGPAVAPETAPEPVARAYRRLVEMDDQALAEIDRWIKEQQQSELQPSPLQRATLKARIEQRLKDVEDAYREFLEHHPDHYEARMAYGSFLNEIQDEEAARQQWEKARRLDPSKPAPWNNLANYFGHNGPVTNAFAHYEKAIELDPDEPLYHQNLATTVYLFRREAARFYDLPVMQVLEKAMKLYHKALELDPDNFILASEVAQTYYGIPAPASGDPEKDATARADWLDKALEAWRYAYRLARDEVEREGVRLHLARVQINAGRFDKARENLQSVTNDLYRVTRRNLLNLLQERETKPPPDSPGNDASAPSGARTGR